MGEDKKKLGEMLLDTGLIDESQLSSALEQQKQWGGRLASILIGMGFIDEQSIASVLEKKLGQKYISLENTEIPAEVLKIVNHDIAVKYSILPMDLDKKTLTVAMSDPTDLNATDELSFALGLKIKPVLAIESSINKAIQQHYSMGIAGGKKHVINTENLPKDMVLTRNEPLKPVKPSYSPKALIEALSEVLIEKGLIKEEELSNKLNKRLKQD